MASHSLERLVALRNIRENRESRDAFASVRHVSIICWRAALSVFVSERTRSGSRRRATTHPDDGGWPCEYAICAFSVKDLTCANVQGATVAGAVTGASAKRKKKVGSFPMNRFTLVFAVLSVVAAGSFAAAPRAASH